MGSILAIATVAAILQGCGGTSGSKTPPPNEIHANTFSKEQLNGPLSNEARANGAQVAAPPTR
jgi:hypothetical protein